VPAPVALGPTLAIAAGANHTCGIAKTNSGVYCWGANDVGQTGTGIDAGTVSGPNPTLEGAIQIKGTALGSGDSHTCAIRDDKTLWCWGSDVSGELGDGSKAPSRGPVQVTNIGTHARQVVGGSHFSCAVTDDGTVLCWGKNDHGQCGQTQPATIDVPMMVSFDAATAIAAGGAQACARRDVGSRLQCWGNDAAPAQIGVGAGAIAVSAADRCVAGAAAIQCTASNPRLSCP
jgi:alpha-tubulin suppressor-like RCC1 family protein